LLGTVDARGLSSSFAFGSPSSPPWTVWQLAALFFRTAGKGYSFHFHRALSRGVGEPPFLASRSVFFPYRSPVLPCGLPFFLSLSGIFSSPAPAHFGFNGLSIFALLPPPFPHFSSRQILPFIESRLFRLYFILPSLAPPRLSIGDGGCTPPFNYETTVSPSCSAVWSSLKVFPPFRLIIVFVSPQWREQLIFTFFFDQTSSVRNTLFLV